MALIRNLILGGTNEQYLGDTSVSGAVNIRASHTMMCRMKHSSTSTSGDIWPVVYSDSGATNGSTIARSSASGVGSTSISAQRASTTPTFNKVDASGTYGNTTTWYHHAFVYDATAATITHYVDGTSVGSIASATTLVTSATGCFYLGILRGKLADVAYFSRALSAGEVASMAAYRVAQVTSGLIGFYRLDSGATDTSGQGNNLSSFGSGTAVAYSTADNPPQPENPPIAIDGDLTSASTLSATITNAKPAAGTLTSASTLSATITNSKPVAATATSASTLTGSLRTQKPVAATATSATTLSSWIRPRWGRRVADDLNTDLSVFISITASAPWTIMTWRKSIAMSDPAHSFAGLSGSAGFVHLAGSNPGTNELDITVTDSVTSRINYSTADNGAWHHMAVTFDGVSTLRAYLDGTQVATSALASFTGTLSLLAIDGFSTNIAEFAHVKVWTAALTATEVGNEATYYTPYNQLAQLFGWWQLGWQNVTLDSSGNGHTLTDNGSTEAQNESPGVPMFLLASTATSASTLTGALTTAKPLAANSLTSASTLTGTATTAIPLAANSLTSASTFAGTLGQAVPLATTATSASTLTGALGQSQPLASTATSASTLTGNLGTAKPLSATTLTSASTLSGAMIQSQPLASSATSASTLTATIGVNGLYSGTAFSASTLTGSLVTEKLIAATATSASTLSASLVQTIAIASSATSASTLTGDLKALSPIAGTATSASTLTGSATVTYPVAGTASSASTFTAAVSVTKPLAATATSASTLTGALLSTNQLVGSLTSASTLTGALTIQAIRLLSGTSTSASSLFASLSVLQIASATGDTYTDASATAFYTVNPPANRPDRQWPPRPR